MIEAAVQVQPGEHRFEFAFRKDEGLGGTAVLRCDGQEIAPGV